MSTQKKTEAAELDQEIVHREGEDATASTLVFAADQRSDHDVKLDERREKRNEPKSEKAD